MTPTQRAAAESLADALQSGADDPMWAHHAEIKKSTLGYAAALLRELLAEPQGEPVLTLLEQSRQNCLRNFGPNGMADWIYNDLSELLANAAPQQQKAEPVQEPVAYVDPRQLAAGYVTLLCVTRPEYRSYADVAEGIHYTPVYLHPPQQPMRCPTDGGECGAGGYCRPEPQQRKPLTDKQIEAILDEFDVDLEAWKPLARAIERAITGEPT